MTNLRKAAEMALERLESHEYWMDEEAIQALRQALAQPEQDKLLKQGWRQCAINQRTTQYCGMAQQAYLDGVNSGIAAEREACAKLVDAYSPVGLNTVLTTVAAAIRARSEK